jgi:hypothetical protein
MDFREAAQRLGQQLTTAEIAAALGVSEHSVRQARLQEGTAGYRKPPQGWRAVLAKLARSREGHFGELGAQLEREAEAAAFEERELKAVAADVSYELWMFLEAAQRLADLDPGGDPVLINALIEAIAVHCRNLDEFFFSSPRGDDVRAVFYVPGWPGAVKRPPVFNQVRPMVNKKVSHLTFARVRPPHARRGWPFAEMFTAVTELRGAFWSALPPERRPWFDEEGARFEREAAG